MTNGRGSDVRIGKMSGEEYKGDIIHIFGRRGSRQVPDFEWGVSGRVEHLRSALNGRKSTRINKFLWDRESIGQDNQNPTIEDSRGVSQRTCKNTLPNMRSVSSRKAVVKMTVTRSGDAWT